MELIATFVQGGGDVPAIGVEMNRDVDRAPTVTERLEPWIVVVVVGAMAAYLVIGIIAWTWMIVRGVGAPDSFVTILAAIVGVFGGIIAPLRGPGTRPERRD